MNKLPNMRGVRVIRVVEVETVEGAGVDGDPIRPVIWYYDDNGVLLAKRDTWKDSQP